MLAAILIAAVWFSAFIVVHVWWLRVFSPAKHFNAVVCILLLSMVGASATLVCFVLWTEGRGSESLAQLVVHLSVVIATIGALFILYMPLYFVVATSLTIQTLNLLNESAIGNLNIDQLRAIFTSRPLVAERLNTMEANGYLAEDGGKYTLASKGAVVAYFFRWLKLTWRLGPGG